MPSRTNEEFETDAEFEVVDARGPGVKRRVAARPTRKSTRTKLPSIPKVPSPDATEVAGTSSSAAIDVDVDVDPPEASKPAKRKRSTRSTTRSPSHGHDDLEYDELEEGSKRKYKKPAAKRASPKKGKVAAKPKEPKPKKISKAAMERAKLEELHNDEHFGKLDDATIKRIAKAHLERMYLIHRFHNPQRLREEFDVCGSKGNVYKVVVTAPRVECTCMDFHLRRQVCKHLLFVYIKVLRLPGYLPVYSGIRLSNADIEDVFEEALHDPVAEALANPVLRKAWESAVGYKPTDAELASGSNGVLVAEEEGKKLIPGEGDVCGVCYEDLEIGSTEGLEFCLKSCGRPIHTDCLQTWFNSRGYAKTCIWCRAPWHDPNKVEKPDLREDGYGIGLGRRGAVVDSSTGRQLNLAEAAGIQSPTKSNRSSQASQNIGQASQNAGQANENDALLQNDAEAAREATPDAPQEAQTDGWE